MKPGKFDEYMKYLAGDYKKLMEAQIKAGLVVRYAVFSTQARTPQDADLILSITVPNYAALDKVDEADAIAAKLMGSSDVRDKRAIDRGAMREVLGGQLVRELILK